MTAVCVLVKDVQALGGWAKFVFNDTEKTIKVHRSRVMTKMRAESLAQLVVVAERLGITNQES